MGRAIKLAAALPLIALLGCRTAVIPTSRCSHDLGVTAPIIVECLPEQADAGRLVVVNLREEAAHWYLLEDGGFRQLVPPPVSLFMVDSLAVSPDGRFIAVVSVGEGHPMLDVLDLSRVVEGGHGDRALATVNPYPGWLAIDGWRDGALQVTSDRPLPECCDTSGAFQGETCLDPPKPFLLDPTTASWASR